MHDDLRRALEDSYLLESRDRERLGPFVGNSDHAFIVVSMSR
jgi:hypothetical protein